MKTRRRRLAALAAAVGLTAAIAGTALAGTIVGTARGETLQGTRKADRLYGRGGDDRLLGRGGNDLLVGGPGADRISCGAGRDRVQADARDTVAKDCEVVTGLPKPKPPPPPPPPPIRSGPYGGPTSQSRSLSFQVTPDLTTVTDVRVVLSATCDAGWTLGDTPWSFGSYAIAPDRTFGRDFARTQERVSYTGSIRGTFDPASGNAAGTLRVDFVFTTDSGTVRCQTGEVRWDALKQ